MEGYPMHTDPVCGMQVEPATAAAAWDHEGTTYYFCSIGCWERFREDPAGILARAPEERSM
jgi:Cu+-exporting ATPase